MEITLHYIASLSILVILQLLGLVWFNKNKMPARIIYGIYLASIISICFAFSYPLEQEINLSLTSIPFILGILYSRLVPLLVFTTIVLHAIFFGFDLGFWLACISTPFYAIILWKISPWFLAQTSNKRIQILVQTSLCLSIVKIAFLELFHIDYPILDVVFAEFFIQSLGIGMLAFFTEEVNKSIQLKNYLLETKKNDAIEQMGATISHEIRNPLTAAIGFVQLLQAQSPSTEKQSQYLSIIRSELKSAERVVENYLALAKPEEETFQTIHVELQLYNVLKLLIPSAQRNKVYIKQHFSESHIIQANQQKFHQCFINLIKNAIESMPNGGTLCLKVINDQQYVRIIIEDDGIGMTPEQVSKLGEPYFSTKGDKGTGLGMLVVFNFIKEMNGTIHVESEFGKGTIFEIWFESSITPTNEIEIIDLKDLVLS
ncbi:sensor histidine kinase [Psychrobacillus antarcticus]|uniref:sensor histidine kinase n=1 Tax=Psychrobacillus antarcticus TaxID=2879115 RepID=UPI00240851F9|nr:HAMP domain-containing sensor histidine kinase [Psychrobacillus antarcticus]